MLPGYAELHCRSCFSFLTGASRPPELVAEAQRRGYAALAITDECSLSGVVHAHEAALEARIDADPKDFEARFALATLLAQRQAWSAAFAQLLEVVLRDRADARKQARDKLVEWFPLCPDPKAVTTARRELSMYLN